MFASFSPIGGRGRIRRPPQSLPGSFGASGESREHPLFVRACQCLPFGGSHPDIEPQPPVSLSSIAQGLGATGPHGRRRPLRSQVGDLFFRLRARENETAALAPPRRAPRGRAAERHCLLAAAEPFPHPCCDEHGEIHAPLPRHPRLLVAQRWFLTDPVGQAQRPDRPGAVPLPYACGYTASFSWCTRSLSGKVTIPVIVFRRVGKVGALWLLLPGGDVPGQRRHPRFGQRPPQAPRLRGVGRQKRASRSFWVFVQWVQKLSLSSETPSVSNGKAVEASENPHWPASLESISDSLRVGPPGGVALRSQSGVAENAGGDVEPAARRNSRLGSETPHRAPPRSHPSLSRPTAM